METAPCSCGSQHLNIFFIEDQGVHHVICETCQKEWIE